MLKESRWMVAFILILFISALACSALSGDDESEGQSDGAPPEQEAQEAVDDESVDQESPPEEPEAEESAETPLSDALAEEDADAEEAEVEDPTTDEDTVEESTSDEDEEASSQETETLIGPPQQPDSYRIEFTMTITEGIDGSSAPVMSVTGEGAITNDPAASSLTFHISGIEGAEAFSDITMVQIGDTTYMSLPTGDCLPGLFGQDDIPFGDLTGGEDFVNNLTTTSLIERNVEVNGIQADHYSFDQNDLASAGLVDDTLDEFRGDLFVTKDGYPVRIAFSGLGGIEVPGADSLVDSQMSYLLDFFDINEPIDIAVPDGCGEPGDTDLPMVADAFEISNFMGIISYKSDLSIEEISDFYRDELTAAGWTLDSEFSAGTSQTLSFSLDSRSLLITIDEDAESDSRTVQLFDV